MILSLNNWERVSLSQMVGAIGGDAGLMHKAFKILDVLEYSDKEALEVGLVVMPPNRIEWQTNKDWEIEIPDELHYILHIAAHTYQGYKADERPRIRALWEKIQYDPGKLENPVIPA